MMSPSLYTLNEVGVSGLVLIWQMEGKLLSSVQKMLFAKNNLMQVMRDLRCVNLFAESQSRGKSMLL